MSVAVVAIDMGYGHLRPARSIASQVGAPVLHADRSPLSDVEEQIRWQAIRRSYERLSRISGLPWAGRPLRALLERATNIPPLHPFRDLSSPNLGTRILEHSARQGLGRSIVSYLQEQNLALLTTFYSPAVLADYHGYDRIYCVVTDSDINRVWAPIHPSSSKIYYLAPSGRVVRRLRAYGVPKDMIELTGFPLPHSLIGGTGAPTLRANLRSRLARLDPKRVFGHQYHGELEALGAVPHSSGPPHLVFAVGGAGAQAELPGLFLPSLAEMLKGQRIRLTLVAGVRREVQRAFQEQLERAKLVHELGRSVEILFEPDLDDYFDRLDALLAHTDVLWTKPSEMVFYAGLGIPLLLTEPIGVHESYNRRFARENGVAFKQRNPRVIGERLRDLLDEGYLATAAWAGYKRLPHLGLYRILERVGLGGAGG